MEVGKINSTILGSKPVKTIKKLISRHADTSLKPIKSYAAYMKEYGIYIRKNLTHEEIDLIKKG